MTLRHVGGLDHLVILVRDLGLAANTWRSLGFTLSPRGTHSTHKGTANYTMMLGRDYLELLGILTPTTLNDLDRTRIERFGEGVDRAALRTDDAAGGLEAIRALGIGGTGPQSFSRPVCLPDGRVAEAAFRTFEWSESASPFALRLFACEHLTPDTVWIPELTRHPNTATRIKRLECLASDARSASEELAARLAATALPLENGAWRIATGIGRADIDVLDGEALARRYPGVAPDGCRRAGAAVLVLEVTDLDAAARATRSGRLDGEAVWVSPADAHGVLLVFEEA